MKRLIVMRHAQALMANFNETDFDRALTELGEDQARVMGNEILTEGFTIEQIVTSPAKRTLSTANIVAKSCGLTKDQIMQEAQIYNAESETLIEVVSSLSDTFSTILLVGHNPGVTELCMQFSHQIFSLRPASVCAFQSEVDTWQSFCDEDIELIWRQDPGFR